MVKWSGGTCEWVFTQNILCRISITYINFIYSYKYIGRIEKKLTVIQLIYNYTTVSPKEHITCGVPQGSVLGLILYNLYINDLVNVSNKFKYVLFADDTNILYSDIKNVQSTVNKEHDKIHRWLCTNKLSINLTKTKFMVFSKSRYSTSLY